MIKVIMEHRAKEEVIKMEKLKGGDSVRADGARLFSLFEEGRAASIRHPGHISAETLVDAQDPCHILVISSWQSLDEWEHFKSSEARVSVHKQMEPFLVEPPKFHTYRYLSYERARRQYEHGEYET